MKKLLLTLAVLLLTAPTFGQGTINFTTRIPGVLDAPVFGPGDKGLGAFGGNAAQLFLFSGGVYTALTPATTFRTTPAGAAQAYVLPPATPVTVPNIAGGSQAIIVLRAWSGAGSYETAGVHFKGQSNPIVLTLGGDIPGQPPLVPANLVGLQGFSILFPEPSTIPLALLGAAALLSRRRK